jgi:hypothetical protein
MKVAIGRIVRFIEQDSGTEWPAIITVVHSDTLVSLQVFKESYIVAAGSVPFDSAGGNFTWHWPDRG